MLSMGDVLAIVSEFSRTSRGTDPSSISPDTRLLQQGYLDSFGLVELIGLLEGRLGVDLLGQLIPEDFETVRTLYARLEEIGNG